MAALNKALFEAMAARGASDKEWVDACHRMIDKPADIPQVSGTPYVAFTVTGGETLPTFDADIEQINVSLELRSGQTTNTRIDRMCWATCRLFDESELTSGDFNWIGSERQGPPVKEQDQFGDKATIEYMVWLAHPVQVPHVKT